MNYDHIISSCAKVVTNTEEGTLDVQVRNGEWLEVYRAMIVDDAEDEGEYLAESYQRVIYASLDTDNSLPLTAHSKKL